MLSAIGLIIAIALLIVMIVKGVDMITASVVTAAIILVTSGLDFWEGLLKTFSEGAGSFCTSWFLILALGGIFGELVNQTGLATKVAKSLSAALGAKRVGLIIMICTFFITLLGINGYIMVFVLYPIADSLLRENKICPPARRHTRPGKQPVLHGRERSARWRMCGSRCNPRNAAHPRSSGS